MVERDPMSDDSRVEVLPVPEGSIIWLHNVALAGEKPRTPEDDDYFDLGTAVAEGLHHVIGHNKFAVLCTNGDGVVDVLGEDDLVARVRAALEPTTTCGATAPTIGPVGGVEGAVHVCVLPVGHIEVEHETVDGTRFRTPERIPDNG